MARTVRSKIRNNGGFTLVEVLVSIAVFSIVVSIAAGGIVRAFRMQNQIIALISVNSNASLSIEQMAREIRVGYDFASDGSSLSFTNSDGQDVVYEREEAGKGGAIKRRVETSPGNWKDEIITADNIDVKHLIFYPDIQDNSPVRITISLGISPRDASISSSITNVQTTISARQIDG